MGSRIMHSIIGHKIAQSLSIEDRAAFLLGSIAPDAVSENEDKNVSHFFSGKVENHTRGTDFNRFLQKYDTYAKDNNAYILGYYTHLIADDLWLKGFYLPWLRNRMAADDELHTLYHNDFRLLNGKLLHYYRISEALRETFTYSPTLIELEEIPAINIEKFVPYILGDMEYDKNVIDKPLHVFTFTQILGYIETSVELGLFHLRPVLTK